MLRWLCGACMLGLVACQSGGGDGGEAPKLPDTGLDDAARAKTLLEAETSLPGRAEVVALTDRLSIAAGELENSDEAQRLLLLSAELRERVWRLDRSATDAREAIELYGQVAEGDGEEACDAELKRARLSGELSGNAAEAYRELYLALERQSAGEGEERDACTRKMRVMLVRAESYRPTGEAWHELQRQGASRAAGDRAEPAPSGSADAGEPIPPPAEGAEEVVVAPTAGTVSGPSKLTKVTPYSFPKGGRVVLELEAPARYETGVVPPDPGSGRGHRVYVDLLDTGMKGVKKDIAASGMIERVRLGQRKSGTRVVLDLASEARRRVFYLPDPFRVVIDVMPSDLARPAAETAGEGRVVRRVTLDPGHGGWDTGAIGPTGLREKDVALDIAHRAAPALASELGVETMLTRDKDVFVELEERTARANAFQSDLFVSIHCNATENGQARGYEVFILDPNREADKKAMRLVARENHTRPEGAMDPVELDAQLTNIARGLTLARTTEGSRTFADLLRTSTSASLATRYPGLPDHGVKTAGFFVLVGAHMPAALYETSFISNPDDEAKLGTADYRQKLADSIVNAVRAYAEGHGG